MSHGRSTVFVGNIPYDTTEEDLRGIFSRVGADVSLRLVYDKDTRQPKGYAFCDFPDADSAMAAIRELSDAECNGRRLRLDLADNALRGAGIARGAGGALPLALPAPEPSASASSRFSRPALPSSGPSSYPSLPGLPAAPPVGPAPLAPPMPSGVVQAKPAGTPGAAPAAGGPGDDAGPAGAGEPDAVIAAVMARADIAQAVAAMPPAQLQLCLGAMQRLTVEAPEQARAMLQDNPQLCHALLHAQLLLGLSLEPSLPPSDEELQRLRAEHMGSHGALLQPPLLAGMPPLGCLGGGLGLAGMAGGFVMPPPVLPGTHLMPPPPPPHLRGLLPGAAGFGTGMGAPRAFAAASFGIARS